MIITIISGSIFILCIGILVYGNTRCKLKDNMSTNLFFKFVLPAASVLVDILPEGLFGSQEVLEIKYIEINGEKNCAKYIRKSKVDVAALFFLIVISFSFILAIASYKDQYGVNEISKLERPEWGEGNKIFHTDAIMNFGGEKYKDEIALRINQRLLADEEVADAFNKTKVRILTEILGENKSIDYVYLPLKLYTKDESTNVRIQWKSDFPELIDSNGYVYSSAIDNNEKVILSAKLNLQDVTESFHVEITIIPFEKAASLEEIIQMKTTKMLEIINKSSSVDTLSLPDSFENMEITWLTKREDTASSIFIIMIISLIILFLGKYEKLNKQIRRKRLQIERDFPDFICKLVLLMNAGFIVQSALEKIVDDYNEYLIKNKKKPLYDELSKAIRNVEESNISLTSELKDFALRCHVKEVMRFVAIISENIYLGSALTEKLQYEADQIWQQRKNKAEELGKIAETKLTFPLVILLLVLMAIIMTPALMEM